MKISALIAIALLATSASVNAGMATTGWYEGNWRCTLDGRQTRIVWKVVSVDLGSGDTSVASAAMRGRFWDRGSWADLNLVRSTGDTINFRHADGNSWFLRKANSNSANGYSTWNKQRYQLSCSRA